MACLSYTHRQVSPNKPERVGWHVWPVPIGPRFTIGIDDVLQDSTIRPPLRSRADRQAQRGQCGGFMTTVDVAAVIAEVLVADITPGIGGTGPSSLAKARGGVFFAADDGRHGREPWRSNGTAAGTVLVKDINAQPA